MGVWRVDGDRLVIQRTRSAAEGREEGTFSLHKRDGVVVARSLSGPRFCLPGIVKFE